MSDAGAPAMASKAPWHFWVVAILALLWNALGAYDYVMTEMASPAYFEMLGVTPEMAAYYAGLPAWHVAAWAIGVWGAVLAVILLLLRKAWAVWLFAISLAGMLIGSTLPLLTSAEARAMGGTIGMTMAGVILVIGVAELLYAMAMKKRGVLR